MSLTVVEIDETKEIISTILSDLSPTSRNTYEEAIRQFIQFSVLRLKTHPYQFPYDAVMSYKSFLKEEKKYSATTINKKLSAVKRFMEVASIHEMISPAQYHAVDSIKGVKVIGKPFREWASEDKASELINIVADTNATKRDRIILVFGLVLGLRREEMVNIVWGQFIQVEGYWIIKDLLGKGGTVYNVVVPEKYAQMILEFGREDDDSPILVSVDKHDNKRSNKLAKESVNYILTKYGVAPHTLRRTSATLIIKHGGDIREAQQHLRHQNQATTEKYIDSYIELEQAAVNRINL